MRIRDYYLHRYGEPSREAKFVSSDGAVIKIYKWEEGKISEGVSLYSTDGAGSTISNGQSSFEFFIGFNPAQDEIVEALAEVAVTGNGAMSCPSDGDTVKLTVPLWEGTAFCCFMFIDGSEIIPNLTENNCATTFMQLVPLYETELAYKIENGHEALWILFENNQIQYWDPFRKKAV